MAYTLLTNVSGLADPGLAAAYQAGEASTDMPLARFAMIFPWASGSFDQALAAPPSGYASQSEGATITPESYDQIGTASITPAEFSLAYSLSSTAYRTLPRALLMRAAAGLGAKQARFWESQLAAKFNNAEGTTTTIDGVAWGSNSHTLASGTQDNLVNAALSHSAYQTAVELLMGQVDHRGTKMGGRPTALLVATDTMVTGGQVLGSSHTGADDRTTLNVLAGSADLAVSADLNNGAWFLFDEQQWAGHGGLAVPVVRAPAPKEIEEQELTYRFVVSDLISAGFGNPVDHRGSCVGNT